MNTTEVDFAPKLSKVYQADVFGLPVKPVNIVIKKMGAEIVAKIA